MLASSTRFWKSTPALRLLVPFALGILTQWYWPLSLRVLLFVVISCVVCYALLSLLPLRLRFQTTFLHGFMLQVLVAATAMGVVYQNDVRNDAQWFGRYTQYNAVLVTVQEPLVEKPNSYKAKARVETMRCGDSLLPANGTLNLYFKKDAVANLRYGSQLWVFEKVVPIRNSGNPGGFDYERYALFQGLTHQAYLTATDFILLPATTTNKRTELLFRLRQRLLQILKTYIQGNTESGLAEALLIGYKDDLDKTLVQSYSNTGVVHIIAISGLHVGLIYAILIVLTKPLRGRRSRWLRFALVLSSLWAFGLLAGAQPSVMRSVVMFSVIAAGVVLERQANLYNNLALSALLLLCYNPFWLWDVGFQLSYSAVLSIVLFFKPVYNSFYFQNKALDAVWKLMAVTLAAQIFTTPISLYYFHQFPLLFLLTNLVAVPLSSGILIGEILLCVCSFIPPVAQAIGWLTTGAIAMLNHFIQRLEKLPFALWQGLSISAVQTVLLLLLISALAVWWLTKNRAGFWAALTCLTTFSVLRTFSICHAAQQQGLIVYNISKHQAIDVVAGRTAWFAGDALSPNDPAQKQHLQPSRLQQHITRVIPLQTKAFQFCGKKILILDTTITLPTFSKAHIDILILSKNPKLYLKELLPQLQVTQVVLDASVPAWKATLWQQDCDALQVPCYNVAQKGAFVMPVPRPTFAAL